MPGQPTEPNREMLSGICISESETPKPTLSLSPRTGESAPSLDLPPGEMPSNHAVEQSSALEPAQLPVQQSQQRPPPQSQTPVSQTPTIVKTYITAESLENRKSIPQILTVTPEQIRGFSEVLKSFREQDYFHIQAQKTRNPVIKKALEELQR